MSSAPPSDRSDLVVVAARRGTTVQVVDVLRHWSALELVTPVLVVDIDAMRPGQPLIPAFLVADGRTRGLVLQDHLATRARTDLVRLVCLTEAADDVVSVHPDQALALLDGVRASLQTAPVVQLHVIGLPQQAAPVGDDVAWLGWHNVAIAPENAMGPDHGVLPIVHDRDDAVRRTHLVAAICSLAGLWSGRPDGAFDGRDVPPSRSMTLARSFSRHLSAQQVEAELLARLADVGEGFPLPRLEGEPIEVIEDEVAAVTDMADALVAKHTAQLTARQRQPLPTRPQTKVGAMQALRMFFGFLWAAIKNAPRSFADRVVNEVSARTARLVGGAVFGSTDSDYAVIVNGVGADGLPASMSELDRALDSAHRKLRLEQSVHASAPALGPVWKDFVAGGLTLVDGGARVQELAPRERGARRAVVLDPARIAPDPADVFTTAEAVSAHLKDPQIASYDVLAARQLDPELEKLGQRQPHVAGPAASAQQSLRAWGGQHQRSYVGHVGWQIARGIHQTRTEIGQLASQLREAMSVVELPQDIEQQQRSLASRLRVMAFALVAVVLVLVALTVGELIAGVVAIGIGVLALLSWLVASLLVFMKGQRDLFALLHRRQEAGSRIDHLHAQLGEALEDLTRLSRAYHQYCDWARAFGTFVRRPFGSPAAADDHDVLVGTGLPLNHRFGAARPNDAVLDEAAARMRRDLYQIGWAGTAWEAFVADVPAAVGDDAFRVREEPDVLFHEVGAAGVPLLARWSQAVAARGDWDGGVDSLRDQVARYIDASGSQLAPRLLANVETRSTSTGAVETVDYDRFMSRLDQPMPPGASHHTFDRQMFSDGAQSAEPWRVAETVSLATLTGLARSVVVTQLSHGFNSYDLAGGVSTATDPGAPAAMPAADIHRPSF